MANCSSLIANCFTAILYELYKLYNSTNLSTGAVIVAAGSGERFGKPKQFELLAGLPLFLHSVRTFASHPEIEEIVLVVPEQYLQQMKHIVDEHEHSGKIIYAPGGPRRQDSLANGLSASWLGDDSIILVHDGARPLVTTHLISRVREAAMEHNAAIAATPVVDTIKRASGDFIAQTLSRSMLWRAQTPQAARKDLLLQALHKANSEGYTATDEAELLEKINIQSYIVMGDEDNFKVTYPRDILIAAALLGERMKAEG